LNSIISFGPFFVPACRLGSARAVNRRYISDCVPPRIRMQASAAFVSASALGMACGPALAGLLQTESKLYVFTVNQDTLPGWVMALGWLAYLIWLWISFKEPALDPEAKLFREGSSTGSSTSNSDNNLCCPMTEIVFEDYMDIYLWRRISGTRRRKSGAGSGWTASAAQGGGNRIVSA
jgi:MFS family permease